MLLRYRIVIGMQAWEFSMWRTVYTVRRERLARVGDHAKGGNGDIFACSPHSSCLFLLSLATVIRFFFFFAPPMIPRYHLRKK